jgi:penicillin amidase
VFNQLLYSLAVTTMQDELGAAQFKNLLGTRHAGHAALPRLAADAASPWWDDRRRRRWKPASETLQEVWRTPSCTCAPPSARTPHRWTWGRAHTLTHNHPLGQQKPLDRLFSTGPMPVYPADARSPTPWAAASARRPGP